MSSNLAMTNAERKRRKRGPSALHRSTLLVQDSTFALRLAAILVLPFLSGCNNGSSSFPLFGSGPAPTLDVWAVSEMEKLTSLTPRRQDDRVVSPRSGAIELFAASNETVSFQLVVQADGRGLRDVQVAWTDLRAGARKVPADNVRGYRLLPIRVVDYPAWYVRLSEAPLQPADFYDAMVPLESSGGARGQTVEANQWLVLWLDFHVPRGTLPDEYAGEVSVAAAGRQTWTAKVKVQVYDLVLPDARAVAALGGFDNRTLLGRLIQIDGKPFAPAYLDRRDPAVRRGLLAIRQLMQVAHSHRLDLFDAGIRPLLKRDATGRPRLDWTDYDAIVLPYVDGSAFADRVGSPAWPSPFWGGWPDPAPYGGADSPGYQEAAGAVLALCREHFQQEDYRPRIFLWPSRGQTGPAGRREFLGLSRLAREADPDTPILTELSPREIAAADGPAASPEAAGDSRAVSTSQGGTATPADIFAPPGHRFDPRTFPRRTDPATPLGGTWLAPGHPPHVPPLGLLAGPADLRALPWLAMKYGCSGVFIPDVLDWGDAPLQRAGPLQTTLFYPGTVAGIEGVLPSVRLKWLRRGLQDVAYLQVLRQRGQVAVAAALIESLVRYAGADAAGDLEADGRLDGWVRDPHVWTTARRLLAEEAQQAVNPAELSGRQLLAQRLAWQELRLRTSTVRLERASARVAAAPDPDGPTKLLATIVLDLYNEFDQPAAPVIRVGPLPSGWESIDGAEVRPEPIPPSRRRSVVLSLRGGEIPYSLAGKMDVPLLFEFPDGRQEKHTVAVAAIQAPSPRAPGEKAAAGAIRIDGRLDDWPLRRGNCASDFAILGRRGRLEGGLAKRPTQVFALSDAENLYFAFRCREPDMNRLAAQTDNFVRYEQLMACGEDLVEVVLDPGGRARGPEDLYHLVIKPGGILVAERGIAAASPDGRSAPWASGARVAVSRQANEWIVELAIPLTSFAAGGAAGAGPRFWGVNFGRFASAGQESSNWAGAPRHLYHPKSLGTIYLGGATPGTTAATRAEE